VQAIDIHVAKTYFSRLVDKAAAGEEIIIARAGKPVAKLVPLAPAPVAQRRLLGRLAGRFTVAADFDAPLPGDMLDAFERR
jgi:prevent-host-death family protein